MNFTFLVNIDVQRESGKFESREDIANELLMSLNDANPTSITGPQYDGTFNISDWDVEEQPQPPRKRVRRNRRPKEETNHAI